MSRLCHPHIVRLIEYATDAVVSKGDGSQIRVAYLVLELATGGELFQHIVTSSRFGEKIARYYFKQLVSALEHMHQLGIYHRDLKPENILLDTQLNLKITDFGFSTNGLHSRIQLGSDSYMAPELLLGKEYNAHMLDMFSIAVVLFIMVSRNPPFYKAELSDPYYKYLCCNRPDIFWKEHTKNKPEGLKFFSKEFMDLMTGMLQQEPTHRLSLSEVIRHPWYNGETPTREEVWQEF